MAKSTSMSILPIDQLIRLLRMDVIPRIESKERSRFFIATSKASELELPEDVTVTRRKLSEKREIVKGKRTFGNQRYFTALWPEDNLQEIAYAKIVYITAGIADYLLGDYCAHCPPGTLFLVPPSVSHQCRAPNLTKERQQDGYCALLHVYAFKHGIHFWYSYSKNDRHFNPAENNYIIYSLPAAQTLRSMTKEATENQSHLGPVVHSFATALFAIIAREIEAGNYVRPGPGKNSLVPMQGEDFASEIHQYMEANCHKRLRLEEVAADLFMSRSQLARRLHQEMNTTFVELLTQYRIERACEMLRETDQTFTAIARTLGYHSISHFRSLFCSRTGYTPTEYRKKYVLRQNE